MTDDASKACRARFADYFRCLDRDGNGTVETSDILHVVTRLEPQVPRTSRRDMTRAFHALWDALQHRSTMQGSIDRTCFVDLFEEAAAHAREHGEVPDWALAHLHATLSALDVDGDGGITRREYASWLAAIGSDACADTAFDLLDLDGNGELDIAEIEALFKQWLTQSGDTPGACLMTGRASE